MNEQIKFDVEVEQYFFLTNDIPPFSQFFDDTIDDMQREDWYCLLQQIVAEHLVYGSVISYKNTED